MRHVFFDIETTGFNHAQGDRIVSIGAVAYPDGGLERGTEEIYYQEINPEREIPERSIEIHGLTAEMLADKPVFAEVADAMLAFVDNAVLYAHNGYAFDFPFVNAALEYIDKPQLEEVIAHSVDTVLLARDIYPGQRNGLDHLIARAGLEGRGVHSALEDARLLAQVYKMLLREAD
ncbi:MAG: 3'-5' exoribonuclease [Betaproteobacteria bacterium AqS2]|uniref:DNA-directed DNA polymerase n=1 Tax=Candidatus Amphirhobacter heronislandensis TaxID=1732024 RepID=A0A930UH59_9GAMM|nr:3'-5' exoribonuclease [Betaproteobacteria bacterium AqS2]